MIVLDASAVVELLTNGPQADALRREITERDETIAVPHLMDVEAASALRRLDTGRKIDPQRSEQMLRALEALPAERYAHGPLLRRMWELRRNFTAYDAAYVALAEALGGVLFTCDEKLAEGHRAQVALFRR